MSDYRDYSYRSSDDRLDLYARIYDGSGPPLLLMHGLTRNSTDFEALAAHLAPQYTLIVPEQRGRGNSDYDSDPAKYALPVYVGDMFALLAGLDIQHAGLIGTSMGGLIAMMMGATKPGMFSGIVINDIGPVIEDEGLNRIKGYVGTQAPPESWDEAAAYVKKVMQDAFPDVSDEAFWMGFARNNFNEKDGVFAARYDAAISQGMQGENSSAVPPDLWPMWDMLANIPALVIRGAISDLLSAETVAEMGRRHPDNFAAVEVPNRGHAPMLDEAEAVAAIKGFLDDYA